MLRGHCSLIILKGKYMLKIILTLLMVLNLYSQEVDTENLILDDLGTFFVKSLNLTDEEAKSSADELLEKGMALYNAALPKKTMVYQGRTVEYSPSSNKKESMKYLIASGLLGNPQAAVVAMDYLNFDGFIQSGKKYRLELAKVLDKNGYLYGTYVLGMWYSIQGRDRDLALHYLGIVKDYCKNRKDDAVASLTIDKYYVEDENKKKQEGLQRCNIANSFYRNAKNQTFTTPTPSTDAIKQNQKMKELMKNLMINKQKDAIEKYLKEKEQ